jgi:hypothetical protein
MVVIGRTCPRGNYGPVPRYALEQSKRVLPEQDIEQNFKVVEQYQFCLGHISHLGKQTRQLKRTLAFSEIKHAPGKLKTDIDQRSRRAFMNILECRGLSRTSRGYQYDKAVVKLGSLANSLRDLIGEWFRHY